MENLHLQVNIDSRGVACLTLNRPEVRNALNERLIGEICETIGRLNSNRTVRAIVLTGAGEAFSAGADVSMMRRVAEYSPSENKDDARRLAYMLAAIQNCEKPTIALVNGAALGGGVGLAAACDIVIAAEDAVFGFTEVRLGLIPAVISPFVLQAIGPRQARRLFLTAERFNASVAQEIGLVHYVALEAQIESVLERVLGEILAGGPNALREAKALLRAVAHRTIDDALLEETAAFIARVRASAEGKEGLNAFLEKRAPNWSDGTR